MEGVKIEQEVGEAYHRLTVKCPDAKTHRKVWKRLRTTYPGTTAKYMNPALWIHVGIYARTLAEAIAEVEHRIDTM